MCNEIITIAELISIGTESDGLWYKNKDGIFQSYIEDVDITEYIQKFHEKIVKHISQKLKK